MFEVVVEPGLGGGGAFRQPACRQLQRLCLRQCERVPRGDRRKFDPQLESPQQLGPVAVGRLFETGVPGQLEGLPQQRLHVPAVELLVGFPGLHERCFGDQGAGVVGVRRIARDEVLGHVPPQANGAEQGLHHLQKVWHPLGPQGARFVLESRRGAENGPGGIALDRFVTRAGGVRADDRAGHLGGGESTHEAVSGRRLQNPRDRRLQRRSFRSVPPKSRLALEVALDGQQVGDAALGVAGDIPLNVFHLGGGEVRPVPPLGVVDHVVPERFGRVVGPRVHPERPARDEFAADLQPVFQGAGVGGFGHLLGFEEPQSQPPVGAELEVQKRFAIFPTAEVEFAIDHPGEVDVVDELFEHAGRPVAGPATRPGLKHLQGEARAEGVVGERVKRPRGDGSGQRQSAGGVPHAGEIDFALVQGPTAAVEPIVDRGGWPDRGELGREPRLAGVDPLAPGFTEGVGGSVAGAEGARAGGREVAHKTARRLATLGPRVGEEQTQHR